jgi:hypothetical protein
MNMVWTWQLGANWRQMRNLRLEGLSLSRCVVVVVVGGVVAKHPLQRLAGSRLDVASE